MVTAPVTADVRLPAGGVGCAMLLAELGRGQGGCLDRARKLPFRASLATGKEKGAGLAIAPQTLGSSRFRRAALPVACHRC